MGNFVIFKLVLYLYETGTGYYVITGVKGHLKIRSSLTPLCRTCSVKTAAFSVGKCNHWAS